MPIRGGFNSLPYNEVPYNGVLVYAAPVLPVPPIGTNWQPLSDANATDWNPTADSGNAVWGSAVLPTNSWSPLNDLGQDDWQYTDPPKTHWDEE